MVVRMPKFRPSLAFVALAVSSVIPNISCLRFVRSTEADKAEIVRLILERALAGKDARSYEDARRKDLVVLSSQNIAPQTIPRLHGVNLVALAPEEMWKKAEAEGDFVYLEFIEMDIKCLTARASLAAYHTRNRGDQSNFGTHYAHWIVYKYGRMLWKWVLFSQEHWIV